MKKLQEINYVGRVIHWRTSVEGETRRTPERGEIIPYITKWGMVSGDELEILGEVTIDGGYYYLARHLNRDRYFLICTNLVREIFEEKK